MAVSTPRIRLTREQAQALRDALPTYWVETVGARMPISCWGRYSHVRLIRADGARRLTGDRQGTVVQEWPSKHDSGTRRCAAGMARWQAETLAIEFTELDLRRARRRALYAMRKAEVVA